MKTEQQSKPVIVEKVLSASPARVWRAMTDNNEMKQWYFNLEEFKPEVGFEFEFYGGDDKKQYRHHCVITEVIPEEKLAYTWRYPDYPGNSLVVFELFAEGDKTRVRITHSGVESFPAAEDGNFARSSFNAGWEYILGTSLKDYVEKN